jgi:integrase
MPKHFTTYNNGYWYEAWYEPQPDGKRKLKKKPIHDELDKPVKDRYQAHSLLHTQKSNSNNNQNTTIDGFMPEFVKYLKDKNKKETSIRLYARDVETAKSLLPSYMQEVKLEHIESLLGGLNQSPASKSRIARSVGRFFSVAKIKGVVDKNPLDGFEAVRYKPEVNPYTEEQILKLIETAKELDKVLPNTKGRYYTFIIFALQNGLRFEEYKNLRWKWLDDKRGTYNICIDETFRPKHDHERIIQSLKWGFDLIKKLPRDSDYIFPNSVGKKNWHLNDFVHNIFKGASIKGDLHQIRKTCASYRLACGEPMQNLKAHLGHQSLRELEAYVGKVVNPSKEMRKLFDVNTK